MYQIGKTIVSEEIFEKEFVCNLNACKGQCCVDGDSGAPLTEEETAILDDIFPKIKSYLRPEGIEAIENQGKWIIGEDGEYETPLVNGSECAYVVFDDDKALCGIEKAFLENKIDWKKPISCHLYPIRLTEYSQFTALNYHQWHICSPACDFGKELSVPVFKFLKDPLIRKFGKSWYDDLEKVAEERLK
jgi:hypothetical protein